MQEDNVDLGHFSGDLGPEEGCLSGSMSVRYVKKRFLHFQALCFPPPRRVQARATMKYEENEEDVGGRGTI